MVQPLRKRAQRFCEQLKIELTCGSGIKQSHSLGEAKGLKSGSQRDVCIPVSMAALYGVSETWNQAKCLLKDEWTKKCI